MVGTNWTNKQKCVQPEFLMLFHSKYVLVDIPNDKVLNFTDDWRDMLKYVQVILMFPLDSKYYISLECLDLFEVYDDSIERPELTLDDLNDLS